MAFWNKDKKEVPEELPNLISDDIEKTSGEVHEYLKENEVKKESTGNKEIVSPDILPEPEEEKKVIPKQNFVEPKVVEERSVNPRPVPKSSKEIVSRLVKTIQDDETKKVEDLKKEAPKITVVDKSFFDELQNNLKEGLEDGSKLEELYEDKFLSRDILSDMKGYWEKQKAESILDILGKNFQEKISMNIKNLQKLEKEWQSIYFELIEKEEEMKEQEIYLKDTLKEFVELCKNKKKNLEPEKSKELVEELSKNEETKEE